MKAQLRYFHCQHSCSIFISTFIGEFHGVFFNHSYGLLKIFCCSGMNLLQKAVYKVWRPLGNASLHARGKQRALRVCSRERGGDNSLAHDNERYVCVRGSRQGGDAVEESFSSAPLTFALWERPGAPPSCSHVSADWTPRRWRPSSALLYAAALRWEEKMHKFSHSNGECSQTAFYFSNAKQDIKLVNDKEL